MEEGEEPFRYLLKEDYVHYLDALPYIRVEIERLENLEKEKKEEYDKNVKEYASRGLNYDLELAKERYLKNKRKPMSLRRIRNVEEHLKKKAELGEHGTGIVEIDYNEKFDPFDAKGSVSEEKVI